MREAATARRRAGGEVLRGRILHPMDTNPLRRKHWNRIGQNGKLNAVVSHRWYKDPESGADVAISESFAQTQSQLRETLARRIRKLRLSSKMSQRDLAERAGIRQALVSQIELGEANVTLDSLLKIAIALDIDFPSLFERRKADAAGLR